MLNLNIGILGHVDSGKTTLAKSLSEIGSTAAFDKNPQSQARGITIDLGFSSFSMHTPEHIRKEVTSENIQFTLVDCPGHASLLKTIIGGAQIIDMMLLVIDVTKGIQTQTAECLVIGEIMGKKLLIVLNKIDLLEESVRHTVTEKMKRKLKVTLSGMKFSNVPIVCVAANSNVKLGIENLIDEIGKFSFIPERSRDPPFLFAVDHCFAIKGQGTVMTGTILQGCVHVNDNIDIKSIGTTKKVKSMQMFRKPVEFASQGDRLGICVTQFDPKLMERGLICTPGAAKYIFCSLISVHRIKHFKSAIKTKSKFHITIGYETAIATITCFSGRNSDIEIKKLNFEMEYKFQDILELNDGDRSAAQSFLLLEFETPVLVVDNCIVIGTKLDMDIHKSECRIAFWGKLLQSSGDKDYKTKFLHNLKIYKIKTKSGLVERVINLNSIIVKNMFKKETNLKLFEGLTVQLSTGETGIIESPFGQSGKIKLHVPDGVKQETIDILNVKSKHSSACVESGEYKNVAVTLIFKKFIYDNHKKIVQ